MNKDFIENTETNEFRYPDFKIFLEQEFARRAEKNPKYSLRAFARHLGVDSAFLSKILRGKRQITYSTITRFSQKLHLSHEETQSFLESPVHKSSRASNVWKKNNFVGVDPDKFKVISDWYHYAILELLNVDNFVPDTQWIATNLGITFAEAHAAIERLKRLELILVLPTGEWRCGSSLTTTNTEFSMEAFRKMQKQILTQALGALDSVPFSEREQSSMTLATDVSHIEEAKERIKKFRRELTYFLESSPKKTAVYQVSLSLFPVSHRYAGAMTNGSF